MELPSYSRIEEFVEKYQDYIKIFPLLLQPVTLDLRGKYISDLELEISEDGLKKIQEAGHNLLDLSSDWLNGSGVLEDDIKAINKFNRSQQNKSRREVRELCKWWLETFDPNGDCGVRLFSKCTAPLNQIQEYKKAFKEDTNLNMDFVHGLVDCHQQQEIATKAANDRIMQLGFDARDLELEMDKVSTELSNLRTTTGEKMQFLEIEISNSPLSIDLKKLLFPDTIHHEYSDDPRTFLPFSIRSGNPIDLHGRYSNGINDIVFGVESRLLPQGEAIIAWDEKNNTADSCRIHYSRHHVSIAISDGATQGGFNSGLFSHVLTHFVSAHMPMSLNAMYYYNRKPMSQLYDKLLYDSASQNMGMHSIIRSLGLETAQRISSSEYKRRSLANIAHVIIQRGGAFWVSRFGDCCIFKLTEDDEIIQINVDPDLEQNATNLIGPMTSWGRDVHGNIVEANGTINQQEILFGSTDKVAEYIVNFPEEAAVFVRELFEKKKNKNAVRGIFRKTSTQVQGEDDLCLFAYKHVSVPNVEHHVNCTENNAQQLVIDGTAYDVVQSDRYYANSELGRGVKRISEQEYNNLRHLHDSFDKPIDFFVETEVGVSSNDERPDYFVFMPHLGDGYTNLGEKLKSIMDDYGEHKINEITALVHSLQDLNDQFEQLGVTHLDIGPSNIFVENETGGLICIDPNAFYCEGTFPLKEVGHVGMYGTNRIPTHATCLLTHRFGLNVMIFSLNLLASGINEDCGDVQEIWANFANQEDTLFLTPEQLDVMSFPNSGANLDKISEIIDLLNERFNLSREEIESWVTKKFDCSQLYSFDLD